MDDDNDMLALTVSVPAEQWDFARRRLRYMEAVIVQILRDAARFKEWYSAAELAALGLRGLPGTKQGIARLAASQKWRRRIVTGRGGERHEYHCASLPGRAFDHLIDRVLQMPAEAPAVASAPATTAPASVSASVKPPIRATNAEPAWMLPLLRVLRRQPDADLDRALAALPAQLPAGMPVPGRAEVADALRRLGLAG